MNPQRRPHLLRDETGISLPEMLVYILISVLVVGGLAGMFTSGLAAHGDTKSRDAAAGQAGVALNTLQVSIRNSSAFNITGRELHARVATGNATGWECRAWVLSGTNLIYKVSSGVITSPPADFTAAGWTVLASGVTGTLADPSGMAVPFLREGSSQLRYGLKVQVGADGTSVALEGSAVPQAAGTGSPTACW